MRHTIMALSAAALTMALVVAADPYRGHASDVVQSASTADTVQKKKRKCKVGYRYSKARMKCVKRKYRGSH